MPDYSDLIEKHARRVGIDPQVMKRIMQIESSGNPNNVTGPYHGLFQLDDKEFRNHGGSGNIHDPEQNTLAAANMLAKQAARFKDKHGRDPTPIDTYMIHQQGEAGYNAHMDNPGGVAWKNIRKYYNSDEVAKKAIWGNMSAADQAKYGSVDNVSSANFVGDWGNKMEGKVASGVGSDYVASARTEAKGMRTPAEEKKKSALNEPVEDMPQVRVNLGFDSLVPDLRHRSVNE